MAEEKKMYKLTDANGKEYLSSEKGLFGGRRGGGRANVYGRMDCPSALSAIRRNREEYEKQRVFFKDEKTALAAGFHPCGNCMREHYAIWKAGRDGERIANAKNLVKNLAMTAEEALIAIGVPASERKNYIELI